MQTLTPNVRMADGTEVPRVGFGTYRVKGGATGDVISQAYKAGYRWFDTAELYDNEAELGAAFAHLGIPRSDVTLASKVWNNHQGYDATREALHRSLERLRTDYLDVYLIHWPCPEQDTYVDSWAAMLDAQREGLVNSLGVSNFQPEHMQRLFDETKVLPVLNQVELHPYFNQARLRTWHLEHGILTQSWGPLGQRSGDLLAEDVLISIAKEVGKTPAQVVLRWHLQRDCLPIPKSSHAQRITENIDLFDVELSEEHMRAIDQMHTGFRQGEDPVQKNNA